MDLVGRDEDLRRVSGFVDQAAVGGGALLVVGDPGIGKTAVLDAAAAHAEAQGSRVLCAAAVEFEADLSFAGLHQVFHPLLGELGLLSRQHARALRVALGMSDGAARDPLLIGQAALSLLLNVGQTRPVLLIVDDLPWLDRSSATVLGFVARRLRGTRVGLIGARRTDQHSRFELEALPTLQLAPLDDGSAEQLLEQRFPAMAPRVRARLRAEAQGNPLALLELPAALSTPQQGAEVGLPAVLPLSERLQAVFCARVRSLPETTRRVLLMAALDGTGELTTVQPAANLSGIDALATAERHGLVSLRAGRLVFRHPLTRSAIVQMATAEQRREAHATLAEQLLDQPDRRARHLAAATIAPDAEVAALLEQAAHRTLHRGDAVGAVAGLVRAADLSTTGSERARRLAQAAYLGANVAGAVRDVPRLLEQARSADPDRTASLAVTVAAAYHLLNDDGDLSTAHRLLASAIEMLADPVTAADGSLVEALHVLLRLCFVGGRPQLWEPFDDAVRQLPKAPEDLALLRDTFRDPVRTALPALGRLDDAITGLAQETDPVRITRVAIAASYLDRLDGCRTPLTRVVDDGRQGGAVTSAIEAMFLLANHTLHTGQWDECHALCAEGLRLCLANDFRLTASVGQWLLGMLAAYRGDTAQARELATTMARWAGPRQVGSVQVYASHVRAVAAQADGEFREGYRHAADISPPGEFPSHVPHALWTVLDLVESAVRSGRPVEAAAHVAAAQQARVGELSPRLAMVVAGAAGMASVGDDLAAFERALAVPGASRWPFDLARVRLAYGERLRRARAIPQAREQLAAAVETFDRLGAAPWAARARGEMRATGVSIRRADSAALTQLTPQQREIAELAAAGLTNRQIGERMFLSPRTVGTHLYQLFPKLGVTSRAALRDALQNLPTQRKRV